MADFNSDDQELTAPFEEEIGDFLQADLNLRPVDWANSSTTELLNDGENIVVEESICETVVEEIILEQENENENYLTGLEGNCMENSIVYVFEDPVADYSLDEPEEFVIEESLTYDLVEQQTNLEPEVVQVDVIMDSSQDTSQTTSQTEDNVIVEQTAETVENENESEAENNIVQPETSLENSVNNSVNNSSCSDSDSDRDNDVNSELKDDDDSDGECGVEMLYPQPFADAYPQLLEPDPESSQSFDIDLKSSEFQSPKSNRHNTKNSDSPLSVTSLNKVNKCSPVSDKNLSSSQTDVESSSPTTSVSSASKASVLGKDQIKKRLQSFSLLKQGIQPVPIKKILTKSPKIQVQLQSDTYDELGNKVDEKLVIIKKPPKQGPTPQERARAVINEIEQIKREEQLIYEENLSFISKAINKNKKPLNASEVEFKTFMKNKSFERAPRNYRNRRSPDKDKSSDRSRNKSRELSSEKSSKEEEKKLKELKEREKEKEKEVPRTWAEVKLRKLSVEEICALKEKMFKLHEKNFKKGLKRFEEEEKIYPFRKDDYIKPQLMFEELSLIRNPLPALSVNGATKYYASDLIKFTEKLPVITYCENPRASIDLNKPRKVVMSENPPARNQFMMKIIEGKTEKLNTNISASSSKSRNWYPQTDYLCESKPPLPTACANVNVKTNALLVLSEMYEDEEDVVDTEKDKHKKREKRKHKIEKKKLKLKKKKLKKKKRKLKSKSKSKSKSRSHSKEKHKTKKYSHKDDKKSKRKDRVRKSSKSEEKNITVSKSSKKSEEKKITEPSKKSTKDKTISKLDDSKITEAKITEHAEKKTKNVNEKFNKEPAGGGGGGGDTPNTDEYRSNWESDLDLDIVSDGPFSSKNRDTSLDQNWESEDERRGQYENRRKNSDDKRSRSRSRRSRSLSIDRKQQNIKRNYRSSFLIDLEIEEKKKHDKPETHEKHENNKRSSRDGRTVSLERDKKSSRPRHGDSSEKHQNISENRKTSVDKSITDRIKKSEDRSSERRRSKDAKRDEPEVDNKKSVSDKPETKEMKSKSRHSEEKSHGSHGSNRTHKHEKHESESKTRKSHEEIKKPSESKEKEKSKTHSSEIDSKPKIDTKHDIVDHKVKDKTQVSEEKITNHTLVKNVDEEKKEEKPKDSEEKPLSPEGPKIKIEDKPIITEDVKEDELKPTNELKLELDDDDQSHLGSNTYSKWSSEEDLHKRKSGGDKDGVKLNINYNRSSQWSDDEDFDRKRNVNEHLNKVRSKYRWEDDLETQCRNLEAEIQKKKEDLFHYRSIEEFNKVKSKKDEFSRSYRKQREDSTDRIKSRDKKSKKKNKDKDKNKPKITLNYSDFEDSIEAGLVEVKKEVKPKQPVFDANQVFAKYKAKIKIDYTDFDLSLNECKEKFQDNIQQKNTVLEQTPTPAPTSTSTSTSPVKKINIDFSELLNERPNEPKTQINDTPEEKPKEVVEVEKEIEKQEPVLDTKPIVEPVNSVAEISPPVPSATPPPVASVTPPPVAQPDVESSSITTTTTTTPDPNKLVSEYEEFMKAVCFDDTPVPAQEPEIPEEVQPEPEKVKEIPLPQPQVEAQPQPQLQPEPQLQPQLHPELPLQKESKVPVDEVVDEYTTSSSSSSELTDSESDESSDENSSDVSEMSDTTVLKTVANIKTEVLSDSENDFKDKRKDKRKRNEISESEVDVNKITVKKEIDNVNVTKKQKICNAAFDKNLIEWESSLTTKTLLSCDKTFNPVDQSEIDVFDIAPSTVLPENIPLPQDEIISSYNTTTSSTSTSNDFIYNQSPKLDTISISSESLAPSPTKRSLPVTPVKQQDIETNKQQPTWNFGPEHYEYTPKHYYHQQDSSLFEIVSSSDTSNADTPVEILDASPNVRKRPQHWNLNLTPVKKPLLLNQPAPVFNLDDSDEDFTDKLVKSPEKKPEKSSEVPKEIKETKEQTVAVKEKEKSDKDKPKEKSEKADVIKSDKNRKSISEKDKKGKETDKIRERSNEKEKSIKERDRDRDRERERERDREKEQQRDRDKRRSDGKADRRLPDRKFEYSKNKSRYSRDRSPIRSRSSGRDRSRERSKERTRNSRDSREIRDRDRGRTTMYRRDKYSRSPSPSPNNNRANAKRSLPLPQIRPDDTDFSTHSMELVHSPINSPLDGFKRSLADSTISDSELLTQQITPDQSEESPGYSQLPKAPPSFYQPKELPIQRLESPSSPKRISLDDRINLVLGIEKEPPKAIDTVCSRGPFTNTVPNYQHHGDPYAYARHEYEVYNAQAAEQYPPHQMGMGPYHQYPHPPQAAYYQNPITTENNMKVVQVGNVIQVVPTDQPLLPPPPVPTSAPLLMPGPNPGPGLLPTPTMAPIVPMPIAPVVPVIATPPKTSEMPPKVVQVGNMLQIVPMTIMDTAATATPTVTAIAPIPVSATPSATNTNTNSCSPLTTAAPSTPIPDPVAAPKPIDQLVIERRAEKQRRRAEREQRRIEKEKKRKEKEKRRQLKIKLKTENMIKKALLLETGEGAEAELDVPNVEPEVEIEPTELPIAWPPSTSVILSLPLPRAPSKGILISQGFRDKDDSLEESDIRKVVKFADGICPGEGTSPSGGEELPSPPPPPRKLPKEKRYKKLKLNKGKNKKKVKVKIIRTQAPSDSSDTEDNLPPPPPPPGSPPPHLWPPRIKQPPVNNIHPQLNIPGPGSNTPIYPPPPGPAFIPPPQMAYSGGYPPSVVMGQPSMPLLPGPGRSHHPPVIPVLQAGPPPPMSSHHGSHHGVPPPYH